MCSLLYIIYNIIYRLCDIHHPDFHHPRHSPPPTFTTANVKRDVHHGWRTIWHRTQFGTGPNLAPRVLWGQFGTKSVKESIWHRTQFGTKSIKESIWHRTQFGTGPIWHQECKRVNLAPDPIWHQEYKRANLAPRV